MLNKNSKPLYRNEWKYLIGEAEKEIIKLRLKKVMALDPNAGDEGYMIRSLYFDDDWNSSYDEKMMGVMERKKYRIRVYNCSDQGIKLERKNKVGSYIYKEAASLSRGEVEQILAGEYGFLLKSTKPLLREFYVECMCHYMRPRVIVDYEREPYVMDEGTVRITFDSHVRAALLSNNIFDPDLPSIETLEPRKTIMEVKFTEFIPQIVREIVPPAAGEFTAMSKYVLCYEKTQYLHGWGYEGI